MHFRGILITHPVIDSFDRPADRRMQFGKIAECVHRRDGKCGKGGNGALPRKLSLFHSEKLGIWEYHVIKLSLFAEQK